MPAALISGCLADDVSALGARVSVVIPSLNEAANLPKVLSALPKGLHEVILVDGGSTDGTIRAARRVLPEVQVLAQTRRGKGNAIACGLSAATGDVVVMLDADGSSDPGEIGSFVAGIVVGGADLVKGTRFAHGGRSDDITPVRTLGNRILVGLVNRLCGTRYSDLCYGYIAFRSSCLPAFSLEAQGLDAGSGSLPLGDGFEIETLLLVRAAHLGLAVAEVPSVEHPRAHGESHLHAVRDGLRVLRTILSECRRPLKAEETPFEIGQLVEYVA